jgi:hypothetical protein
MKDDALESVELERLHERNVHDASFVERVPSMLQVRNVLHKTTRELDI